jgi:hypothetical protein
MTAKVRRPARDPLLSKRMRTLHFVLAHDLAHYTFRDHAPAQWRHMRKQCRPRTVDIELDGEEIFVVVDGVRVARRGHPATPQARTWVALEPGFTVTSPPDMSTMSIAYKAVPIQ